MSASDTSNDIAIVGMAGRFPGARSVDELWGLVRDGATALKTRSFEEAIAAGVPAHKASDPNHVNLDATIEDVGSFDAGFFDIGPRDAAIMDPQHRQFLECAWEALEEAGHVPAQFHGAIGVYAGSGMNGYMLNNLITNPELIESLGMFLVRHTANDKDFLSTGVSYRLNLSGPSVNVQTACSTSLVAVHLASQSLLNGECDMALAGGVTIDMPQGQGYTYREGEVLSPDGICRAFDAESKGTVLTSGVGVVVLRRLADAIADRDHIHAVIKASAINNDGAGKVGYLAPSVDGHAAVVSEALALAGIAADSIQYVEAHGTGTALGDPIEVAALTRAFRESTQGKGFVRLGSIKPTVGHLDTAAGVASLIKTATALREKTLPPMAGFTAPNPVIGIEETPFVLSGEASAWPRGAEPRRAGVSSLGVGGTNAHVVLEEAPTSGETHDADDDERHLLMLSAKSPEALERATANLAEFLDANPRVDMADVAFTLRHGRAEFAHRRVVVATSARDGADSLRALDAKSVATNHSIETPSSVIMFPGGGAQYPGMGRELYESDALYRSEVDACLAMVEPALGRELRALLFPREECMESAAERLTLPSLQLPAIFITEYALAKLWMSRGIVPAAMTGHSMGEYTAACLAGVMSPGAALRLVHLRGQLVERSADAATLSVSMSEAALREVLPDVLSLAVVNGPELCAVSGTGTEIERFEAFLAQREVVTRRLRLVGAAHSSLLDPFLAEFEAALLREQFHAPTLPYVSNVTGTWVRAEDATDPAYWVRHFRQTVRFADGLEELLKRPNQVLIEVGPGTTLTALARQQRAGAITAVPSLPHPQDNVSAANHMLLSLGRAWAAGLRIDWATIESGRGRRITLPTYPFERQKHWIEPGAGVRPGEASTDAALPLSEWFSTPEWTLAPLRDPRQAVGTGEATLVVAPEEGMGPAIAEGLRKRGYSVVTATLGGPEAPFLKLSPTEYRLNPSSRDDYGQLAEQLAEDGLLPTRVVHAGGVLRPEERNRGRMAAYNLAQERGFFSLQFLLRALGRSESGSEVRVTAVTNNARLVDRDSGVFPDTATMDGPARVATREFAHITCKMVDISTGDDARRRPFGRRRSEVAAEVIEQIVAEATLPPGDDTVALREGRRWVQTLRPVSISRPAEGSALAIRAGGCYLITGGFGGIASVFADEIARAGGTKLVLVARRLSRARRARITQLEEMGAEVLAVEADVADPESMSRVVADARARFGRIDGVIHTAGTIDDAPIEVKERDRLAAVIAPKALGALVLEQVLDLSSLDFMLLCSSTSAFLGPAGQADYAGANAFLDAFAQHRTALGDRHTVAVNWGMWKDTGMTATARTPHPDGEVVHPWLGKVVREERGETWFERVISPETDWVVDEHRFADGTAVMPGAGYAEIVRAAASQFLDGPLEIRDLEFRRPLVARGPQTLQVRVAHPGNELSVIVVSGPAGVGDEDLVERAVASVARCTTAAPPAIPSTYRSAEVRPSKEPQALPGQHGLLRFGPRWDNIAWSRTEPDRAVALLNLHERYAHETTEAGLHPALLDIATGLGLPLLVAADSEKSLYVPMAYGRLRVFGSLPANVLCEVTQNTVRPTDDVAAFDVTIADEAGNVLVQLDDLMLRRVPDGAFVQEHDDTAAHAAKPYQRLSHLMTLGRACGISATDGAQAFRTVLAMQGAPQLIVTPVPMAHLAAACARDAAAPAATSAVARPQLRSGFEAPRDAVEQQLAEWWTELLGVRDVGVNDDFFDLGGHSLIALRLFARIKQAHSVELGLATLFTAPTISAIAAILRGELNADFATAGDAGLSRAPWPCLVPIKATGTRTPLFCVHGAKGNVLNFRELGRLLPADQPFYGLQLQGLNGIDSFHESIEEMAAHYVTEVRAKQPSGPYLLGGFSGGGLVALEMARQLREAGELVALVLLFDAPAPDYRKMRSFPWFHLRSAESVLQYGPSFLWEKVRGRYYWWNWGKGRPSGIDFNHFDSVLAGHEASEYDGYTVLLRVKTRVYPHDLGWNKWIAGGIDSYAVSGAHESMWRQPHVKVLAQLVTDAMERAGDGRLRKAPMQRSAPSAQPAEYPLAGRELPPAAPPGAVPGAKSP